MFGVTILQQNEKEDATVVDLKLSHKSTLDDKVLNKNLSLLK